jgi:hypothetical protein
MAPSTKVERIVPLRSWVVIIRYILEPVENQRRESTGKHARPHDLFAHTFATF